MENEPHKCFMIYGVSTQRPDMYAKIATDEKKKSFLWGNIKYVYRIITSLAVRMFN